MIMLMDSSFFFLGKCSSVDYHGRLVQVRILSSAYCIFHNNIFNFSSENLVFSFILTSFSLSFSLSPSFAFSFSPSFLLLFSLLITFYLFFTLTFFFSFIFTFGGSRSFCFYLARIFFTSILIFI